MLRTKTKEYFSLVKVVKQVQVVSEIQQFKDVILRDIGAFEMEAIEEGGLKPKYYSSITEKVPKDF